MMAELDKRGWEMRDETKGRRRTPPYNVERDGPKVWFVKQGHVPYKPYLYTLLACATLELREVHHHQCKSYYNALQVEPGVLPHQPAQYYKALMRRLERDGERSPTPEAAAAGNAQQPDGEQDLNLEALQAEHSQKQEAKAKATLQNAKVTQVAQRQNRQKKPKPKKVKSAEDLVSVSDSGDSAEGQGTTRAGDGGLGEEGSCETDDVEGMSASEPDLLELDHDSGLDELADVEKNVSTHYSPSYGDGEAAHAVPDAAPLANLVELDVDLDAVGAGGPMAELAMEVSDADARQQAAIEPFEPSRDVDAPHGLRENVEFTPVLKTPGHNTICTALLPVLLDVLREDAWRGAGSRDAVREACKRHLAKGRSATCNTPL